MQSQPGQIGGKSLSQKNPKQKRAGGVAQSVGLNSDSSTTTKKKRVACVRVAARMAQVVEHLSRKLKALSSNSMPPKNNDNKEYCESQIT
jgi:hypothetical protein